MGPHLELLPEPEIDKVGVRGRRLAQLKATMAQDGIDLCVLTNPVSMRYASDYRAYSGFQSRIPTSALLVSMDGPLVLMGGLDNEGLTGVDEVRPQSPLNVFDSGFDLITVASRFAAEIVAYLSDVGLGATARVGIERTVPTAFEVLSAAGLNITDAEPTLERCRSHKVEGELDLIRYSIAVAELGMAKMEEALREGITENQLWSILHQINVAHDGDWIDGRMLTSGPRSNPWFQEAGHRQIRNGDLVPFDTDMIGPNGYCADISRTFLCGDGPASSEQRELYELARAEIEHNTALLKVGASFRELSDQSYRHSPDIVVNAYPCAWHGVGMTDEYPKIVYPHQWERDGYDGEVSEGLVLSVESYVGRLGGVEGVKLEQMVQVGSQGVVPLSNYPLWD